MFAGFINDILSCILANLQITDLVSVLYGQPGPLNQVQRPLREFVTSNVLQGAPPFEENIRSAVDRLIESLQPGLQETVVGAFLHTFKPYLWKQFVV